MLRIARRRRIPHTRTLAGLVVGGTLLMFALAGCEADGDGSSALKVAEARVSAKEKALADAKADLTDKSAAFCGTSATYITALDRYGDVLDADHPDRRRRQGCGHRPGAAERGCLRGG